MWRWLRMLLDWTLRSLLTGFTLAVLAGLFWYGHEHNWTIPLLSTMGHSEDKAEEATTGEEPLPKSVLWQVVILANEEVAEKAGITTVVASETTLRDEISGPAVLRYDSTQHSQVAPRAAGGVWRILKLQGETVTKGEVIALIEATDVGKAKSDLLSARQMVDLREKAFRRAQGSSGVLPERQLIEAESAYQQARLQLLTAQQALINFGLPVPLDEWARLSDEQVLLNLRRLGLPAGILNGTTSGTLSTNLLPVVSPFAGQVVSLDVGLGEMVSPAQSFCLVAALDPVQVQMDLRSDEAARVQLKMPARFQADGAQVWQVGAIDWISPEVDARTRTVRVRARLANPYGQLRPNTFGTGLVVLGTKSAVTVPRTAIQIVEKVPVVFVALDGPYFQAVPIERGIESDGFVEAIGIAAGDRVVTTGAHTLKAELLKAKISEGE